jgi:protein involved in polysaccharide export with SLBB domain
MQVGPLLDAPISRTAYRLGAGDVVHLAVFGEMNMNQALVVSPEGTLVIPDVGVARVLRLNLDQAQARVRGLIYTLYQNVDVTLTLAQVRAFKVFVVGDVSDPGVRTASSATRVSEIIPPRGGEDSPMRRNVLLRSASGDSSVVDLARFALLGDLNDNPTLNEGDALIVRAVNETVSVTGRVAFPWVFEYRAGETLAELLRLVNGGRGFPPSAADSLRVSRYRPGGSPEIHVLSAADALGPRGQAFRLRPFDAVYVAERANFGVRYVATVQGQVARPGTYPIRPDTTTVRELVAMAGGFTPRASFAGASLRRVRSVAGTGGVVGEAALDSARSFEERQINAIAGGSTDIVVIDFQRLFAEGGDPYDQPVRPGDLLNVPEREYDVAVLGAVARPGLVSYAAGRTVHQYVNMAGGYSRRADWKDAVVLRASTNSRLHTREVRHLEPGDRIVVPFKARLTILERVQQTQSVVGILSGAAVTVATMIALFR